MTIDEAIEKHRKIAETKKTLYDACILEEYNRHLLREYKEHEQLAEWLEELKMYKEVGTVEGYKSAIECYNEEYTIRKSNKQYNKAIDDFVKFANTMPTVEEDDGTIRPMWLEEMAEQ